MLCIYSYLLAKSRNKGAMTTSRELAQTRDGGGQTADAWSIMADSIATDQPFFPLAHV